MGEGDPRRFTLDGTKIVGIRKWNLPPPPLMSAVSAQREGGEGGDRIAVSRSKYEGRRGGVYRSPSNRITLNYTGKINS